MTSRADNPVLRMATPVLKGKELEYVASAVREGWISSQGRFVNEFEKRFSTYCGVAHGVAVSNGTTALHLALAVLNVGPGDEVIIPAITHIAVANAVSLAGARPVLADCDPRTWGLDPASVTSKISPRTKVVIPVHLYGHPVDMGPIMELAEKHGFRVVEDAAEAHGAEYRGRRAGSLGHLGCFSFYANKVITTGEGGMIVTDDEKLAARARSLRDQAYGTGEQRFLHHERGFNYRLTNLQAAIGVAQMDHIDEFIATRRRNAQLANSLLADVPGITLPPEQPWARNVYWMYSILVEKSFPMSRDELGRHLRTQGIDSRPFFHPVHRQPVYETQFAGEHYPVAEALSAQGLNLPSGNELGESDIRRIVDGIKSAAGSLAGVA
jgi:perosamine synthetase